MTATNVNHSKDEKICKNCKFCDPKAANENKCKKTNDWVVDGYSCKRYQEAT